MLSALHVFVSGHACIVYARLFVAIKVFTLSRKHMLIFKRKMRESISLLLTFMK